MPSFHHGRLIVYQKAIDFVAVAATIVPVIARPYGSLRDQLARAATSIALNIAEGSGEFSRAEKRHYYRIARRSASECAALLESLDAVGFQEPEQLIAGLALLNEIIAMLTVMTKSDAALPKNASGRLPPRSEPAPER